MLEKMINSFMEGFGVLFSIGINDYLTFLFGLLGFICGLAVIVGIVYFVILFFTLIIYSIRKLIFKED